MKSRENSIGIGVSKLATASRAEVQEVATVPVITPNVEDELRSRLSASQLRISELAAEVHRLHSKVLLSK